MFSPCFLLLGCRGMFCAFSCSGRTEGMEVGGVQHSTESQGETDAGGTDSEDEPERSKTGGAS